MLGFLGCRRVLIAVFLHFFIIIRASAADVDRPVFDEATAAQWALNALSIPYQKGASVEKLNALLLRSTEKPFLTDKAGLSRKTLEDAFSRLQPCRVTHSYNDLSITAAEHYMYMRTRSAESGDLHYKELPGKYLEYKKQKLARGEGEDLQTTSQPVSPPSDDVKRWGEKGAEHGFLDYERVEGKKASYGISAYAEGINFVLFSSYKYEEGGKCLLKL